ncbi:FxSxx-COOH cyclophane-containing RiPP peptide [Streptomyces sp. NPDC101178]|uniref:FxSxx-COOH cyclophane-containing RiPP peptide n=1 Tax=Streptomyces sp. NPDC101178 TaxID=3366124 RepID=UPI00380FB1D4
MRVKSCRRALQWCTCWCCPPDRNEPPRTAVKTYASPPLFADAKKSRVPLAEIDLSGGSAARKLARVIPTADGRTSRISTFNSAL